MSLTYRIARRESRLARGRSCLARRELRLARRESRLARRESRLARRESHLAIRDCQVTFERYCSLLELFLQRRLLGFHVYYGKAHFPAWMSFTTHLPHISCLWNLLYTCTWRRLGRTKRCNMGDRSEKQPELWTTSCQKFAWRLNLLSAGILKTIVYFVPMWQCWEFTPYP